MFCLSLFQSRNEENHTGDLRFDLDGIECDVQDERCVSQKDILRISQVIPARRWRQVLKEGFGISEDEIYKAEYKHKADGLDFVVFKLLHDWVNRQYIEIPSKRVLYRILRNYQTDDEFDRILQIYQTNEEN